MNEELEPLGLPTPPQAGKSATLSELVAEHPLVAVAASVAVGAGAMALIALATRQRETPAPWQGVGSQVSDKYAGLQAQLSDLAARISESLPSKGDVSRTASHLGDQASKVYNGALNGAKHSLNGVSAAGVNVTQTALAHPLLTSLILGALGTVVASIASSSTPSDDKPSSATEPAGDASA